MNILFVCTANICRSVMAEGILTKLASDPTGGHVSPRSAGVDVHEDSTPDRYTADVCTKEGIDIRLHKAWQLTKQMLEEANLVLCMEQMHKQIITGAFPRFAKSVFLLKEYLHEQPLDDAEIRDPIGKSRKEYEKCFIEIEKEVRRIGVLSDWFRAR